RHAQRVRLDLDHRDLAQRGDGRGAAPHAAGEVQDLAEAAAGLDDVELLAEEHYADFAADQEEEAVALIGLPDDDGSRFDGLPAADAHHLPERDVVEVLEEGHIPEPVELL